MKGNFEPQDYLASANALMALGGRDVINHTNDPHAAAHLAGMKAGMHGRENDGQSGGGGSGGIWPLMVFDAGIAANGQQ